MENVLEKQRRPTPANRFCPGPVIPGHQIQSDEMHSVWVIDQVLIRCSEAEYRCLNVLLEAADRCVPFATLLACLSEGSEGNGKRERMRLAQVMSALRGRLWPLGFEIGSVMTVGYVLLTGAPDAAALLALPDPGVHTQKHPGTGVETV